MKTNLLKRPWFEWAGWMVWLVTVVIFAQHSAASRRELQPRAELIGWIVVALLLAFAIVIWARRFRAAHHQEPVAEPRGGASSQSKAVSE